MERQQEILQENNIKTTISKVINTALEIGLKAVLPDFIEEDVLEIKDKFIQEGFSEGVQEIVDKLQETGKSITGIFTGDFENISQIKKIIQTDGLLDGISDLIDKILKILKEKKIITKDIYTLIKNGKKSILSTVEEELESLYKEDTYSLEKLNQYCEEWKEYYSKKDYEGMSKAMNKISQRLKQSKIVEETINEARNIEKIQEYINESGNIDSLSEDEKELLEKIN